MSASNSSQGDTEEVFKFDEKILTQGADNGIKTFVFTAIATTGWPTREDPKSAKITGLCFLPLGIEQLRRKDVEPKILNRLSLCFNPEKIIHPKAAEVSGQYNDCVIRLGFHEFLLENLALCKRYMYIQPCSP